MHMKCIYFFLKPQLNIVLKYPCNPTGSDFHLRYKNLFSCKSIIDKSVVKMRIRILHLKMSCSIRVSKKKKQTSQAFYFTWNHKNRTVI